MQRQKYSWAGRGTLCSILPSCRGGMSREDYMRICFAMIDVADAVVFLSDAKESAGARLERAYCEYIGKEYEEWND